MDIGLSQDPPDQTGPGRRAKIGVKLTQLEREANMRFVFVAAICIPCVAKRLQLHFVVHPYIYIYMHRHIYIYIYTCVYIYIHMYIYTQTHMYIHTHIYMYIYQWRFVHRGR